MLYRMTQPAVGAWLGHLYDYNLTSNILQQPVVAVLELGVIYSFKTIC
jgi:hypothetical protein